MINGILIDIDGTLLDSNDAHAAAWVDVFQEYNYDIKFTDVRMLIGMGGDKLMKVLIPDLDIKKGRGKEIAEARKKIFVERYTSDLQPTPGARELVEKILDKNIVLIAATSSGDDELHTLLQKADVDDLIKQYTTSSDVEETKPAPDIVEVALQKIHKKPEDVYMIGDTPYDIEAAIKCSIQTIAVRSGGFPDEKLRNAFKLFDNPADILKNWDSLFR